MTHCKFCGVEIHDESVKPVARGSWLDAEKIYLCDEHIPWLKDSRIIQINDPCYLEDEVYEYAVVPKMDILVRRMDLFQVYIALRGWLLVNPKYPRMSPITNIMMDMKTKIDNGQLLNLQLAILHIHWATYAKEIEIDFDEYDFFNPMDCSAFDTINMQNYQDSLTSYMHTLLRVL